MSALVVLHTHAEIYVFLYFCIPIFIIFYIFQGFSYIHSCLNWLNLDLGQLPNSKTIKTTSASAPSSRHLHIKNIGNRFCRQHNLRHLASLKSRGSPKFSGALAIFPHSPSPPDLRHHSIRTVLLFLATFSDFQKPASLLGGKSRAGRGGVAQSACSRRADSSP